MSRAINQIRALRAKAQDDASTASEASSALALIEKLMRKHELTESDIIDLRSTGNGVSTATAFSGRATLHPVVKGIGYSIQQMCEVKASTSLHKRLRGEVKFYGFQHDIEFAVWAIEFLATVSAREYRSYCKNLTHGSRQPSYVKNGFYAGFCQSVSITIRGIIKDRQLERESATSGAIVIIKLSAIDDYISDSSITIKKSRASKRTVCSDSLDAGLIAGSKVKLNTQIPA